MLQKMYSVYDEKAQAFSPPFFLHADGMATRAFSDCVNAPSHHFSKHPYDYTLFRLGEFDDLTGTVVSHAPKTLGNGVQFVQHELANSPEELNNVTPIHADSPVLADEARRNSKVKL